MKWLENIFIGLGVVLAAIIIGIILSIILTVPVYFLWNWLMPEIFGLPIITFWKAWGLNLLSWFLIQSHTYTKSNK